MTDYIAVLLAQPEEQEQGEAPELETGTLTVWLEENTQPARADDDRYRRGRGSAARSGAGRGRRVCRTGCGDREPICAGGPGRGLRRTAIGPGSEAVGRRPPDRWCGGDGGKNGGADGSTGPAGAHHRIPERVRGGLARRSGAQEHGAGVERRNGEAGGDGGAVRRSGGRSGGGRGAGPAVSPGRPAV